MYGKIESNQFQNLLMCVCDISKLNDIGEYLRIISECDIVCPLEFWKKWQNQLPGLAKSAKKY